MASACIRFVLVLAGLLGATIAWSQQPVILVFGDSLSAGYGLPQGKGWVDLLQRKLEEEKLGFRVVNASISGETTLGGRNRLVAALAEYKPRIVVIELGANDGLRGQPLDAMRGNLAAMIAASRKAGAKVVLVGMRIPPNYGPQYTEKFHATFGELARAYRVGHVPFLLDGFADRRELFQSDGIHPDVQAQAMLLDSVWKALGPLLSRNPGR